MRCTRFQQQQQRQRQQHQQQLHETSGFIYFCVSMKENQFRECFKTNSKIYRRSAEKNDLILYIV